MGKKVASFVLAYLAVSLLIVPPVLWATRMVPSYNDGIVLVLDRSFLPLRGAIALGSQLKEWLRSERADYASGREGHHSLN